MLSAAEVGHTAAGLAAGIEVFLGVGILATIVAIAYTSLMAGGECCQKTRKDKNDKYFLSSFHEQYEFSIINSQFSIY